MSMSYSFLEINTGQFNYPRSENRGNYGDEANDETYECISEGYVDYKKSIQDKILAGEQLISNRLFDETEGLDNDDYALKVAMIRHPNTDISEITTLTDAINEKMASAKSTAQRHQFQAEVDENKVYSGYEKKAPEVPPEIDEETP